MNYIQMFTNGGKTSDQELIKGIQKILGVDDEQMAQLLQIGINKYGSLEGIGQALNQATQDLTQNSSPEEVQAAVASVFQTNAESQMFKCGGKLQQLVSKFGKGGNVDCGCGGKKLDMGGPVKNGEYTKNDFFNELNEWTPIKLPNGDSGYARNYRKPLFRFGPSSNTLTQMLITYDENGTPRASSREIKGFFNPNRVKLDTTYNTANNTPTSKDFIDRMNFALEGVAPERPQFKQSGGVLMEEMPGHNVNTNLTRHQARDLAALNQGYNSEQFQFAMANAMNALRNQGLRGRELRERAREMAAGISPVERSIVNIPTQLNVTAPVLSTPAAITAPEQITLPETQVLLDQTLDDTNKKLTRNLNKPTSSKKGVIEVGDVSILGKTPQSNVKVLWGEMPLVSTMFPNQKTNEQIQQEKRDRKAGEIERYMNTTEADEYVSAWGSDPYFKNINRTSDAYSQGQKQAAKNTAITTVADTAAALGIPAAINYAPAAGRFIVNTLKPSPRMLTAEQVQAGWNGGFGAMRDGMFLYKQGGKVKEGIKLAKCGKKVKK